MGCARPGCVPWYEIQNLLRGAVWVISIFALLFALWAMVPWRTDLQTDDVRITIPGYLDVYGYAQFSDYDLGVISHAHTPPGLVALHHALTWMNPLDAVHVVELACSVLFLAFSWRVGSHLHGPAGGLLGLLLCIGMTYSWTRVSGGTARAFAPWMMVALIDCVVRGQLDGIYRLAALASVTYPLITMVCGGVLVLGRKTILHPWMAVALVAGLWQAGRSDLVSFDEIQTERIGANYRLDFDHSLASSLTVAATYRQTRHHDAFLPLARRAPRLARWWQRWVVFDLQRGSTAALVLLYLVLPLVFWRMGWLRSVDLRIPISCILVAAVAHVLAFRLYRPDRGLLYCLPIWMGLLPLLLCRTKVAVVVFLGVLVATTGPGIWRWPGVTCVRDRQAPVFDWIESNTEPGAVFAGEPTDYAYECIPIYAHRRIYMSYEVSSPWWRDIQRDLVTPRLERLKTELLSEDPPDLPGVTHIILRDGVGPGAWVRTQRPVFRGSGYSIWSLPGSE